MKFPWIAARGLAAAPLLMALLSGCSLVAATDPSDLRNPADTTTPPGPDAAVPELDGSVPPDGAGGGCGTTPACKDGTRTYCDGAVAKSEACVLGCGAGSDCKHVVPSNVDRWTWHDTAKPVQITGNVTFNSANCGNATLPNGSASIIVRQPRFEGFTASELCVIPTADFTITSQGTLRIIGSRPVAIVANGNIQIDGTIDASADGPTPGAGGYPGATQVGNGNGLGMSPGLGGESQQRGSGSGGGGGGALCGGGGDGGDGRDADGGDGGDQVTGAWMLAPLVGGSGGGRGAPIVGNTGGFGGGGGGAIQLTARHALVLTGSIRAAGGEGHGGLGSNQLNADTGAGGGGGSGGALLIEAETVSIAGTVLLAGGGGGGGGVMFVGNGGDGDPGLDAGNARASGGASGAGSNESDGRGGSGSSADDADAQSGNDATNFDARNNGGGGGGSAGCFVVRSADGTVDDDDAALLHSSDSSAYRTGTVAVE